MAGPTAAVPALSVPGTASTQPARRKTRIVRDRPSLVRARSGGSFQKQRMLPQPEDGLRTDIRPAVLPATQDVLPATGFQHRWRPPASLLDDAARSIARRRAGRRPAPGPATAGQGQVCRTHPDAPRATGRPLRISVDVRWVHPLMADGSRRGPHDHARSLRPAPVSRSTCGRQRSVQRPRRRAGVRWPDGAGWAAAFLSRPAATDSPHGPRLRQSWANQGSRPQGGTACAGRRWRMAAASRRRQAAMPGRAVRARPPREAVRLRRCGSGSCRDLPPAWPAPF
jgi:hypothetical protein